MSLRILALKGDESGRWLMATDVGASAPDILLLCSPTTSTT